MKILAIESSCDETSAAVIENGAVYSNIISTQLFHSKYGGVIPELASRAHLKVLSMIVKEALSESKTDIEDITALAVTNQPGLIGALITGSNFAKGLALKYNLPVIPVNHIEGHLYSGCLESADLKFPFISLVVSGGHTAIFLVSSYNDYEIIGLTRDDAAGEAFDKIAKLIGLPYPGGPLIDKLAKTGNPKAFAFPRPMINDDHYDFSFSGLKTSVRYYIHKEFPEGLPESVVPDFCASVQEAIVDVLVHKTVKAAREMGVDNIIIAGGVSANSRLRSAMKDKAEIYKINVIAPAMSFCGDNAAMIGFLAEKKAIESGLSEFYDLTFKVNPVAMRAKRR